MRRSNRKIETAQAAEEPHVELRLVGGPHDGEVTLVPRAMMDRTAYRIRRYTASAVLHWYMSVGPWTGKAVLHLFHRGIAGARVAF